MDESASPSAPGGSRVRAGGVRSPIVAELICALLADRTPLTKICAMLEIGVSTVLDWRLDDLEFGQRYDKARDFGFEKLAEECLEIADYVGQDTIIDGEGFRRQNKEWIARSRLRVDTRLKLLACWDPARYGAKLAVDANVKNLNLNLNADIDPVEASRQYQQFMLGAD